MGAYEDLEARCAAQQEAARRRLGYGLLGAVVTTPLIVLGGMWLERKRAHDCACKLPKTPPSNLGTKAGEAGNGSNGSNGSNGGQPDMPPYP